MTGIVHRHPATGIAGGSRVIRPALGLMTIVLPSQALNYALLIGATHVLGAAAFGIFYAAISITNVLIAPSVILGLFIARHVARVRAELGTTAAVSAFFAAFRGVARWGVVGSGLALAGLTLAGFLIGIESFVLVVVIVATALAIYLTEAVRAALQGLQRFRLLGLAGLSWMAMRFVLAMLGLIVIGAPWAGMTGVLVSGLLTCAIFYWVIARGGGGAAPPAGSFRAPRLGPFTASYGVYSLIVYADIIAAYALLDRAALGIYAASSVLPKAIVMLVMPVAQVLFPVLTSEQTLDRIRPASVARGLGMTALIAGAGVIGLLLLAEPVCSGPLAINRCDVSLMTVLAAAAVPLCLLRILVMMQLARGRDLHPLLLGLPLAAYLGFLPGAAGAGGFAFAYAVFAWAALGCYALACIVSAWRPRVAAEI